MSFGKSNNQMSTDPRLTAAQAAQVEASNKFSTNTLIPTYENAVRGATDIYNQGAGGVLNAAQNQAAIARQAQKSLGETGESALRTGVSGLQSLFNPDYEANQVRSALAPAQAQYQQNIANQTAGFGGVGGLGSARQALAGRQLAGSNQALQANTAAQVQRDIAGQRMGVGTTLAGLGQSGIGQALGAAGVATQAAMTPQDFYNKYASVIFGTPASASNLGPTGTSQQSSGFNIGAKI
jgi:hypothetical protein